MALSLIKKIESPKTVASVSIAGISYSCCLKSTAESSYFDKFFSKENNIAFLALLDNIKRRETATR